jgi:hypothetical protein
MRINCYDWIGEAGVMVRELFVALKDQRLLTI